MAVAARGGEALVALHPQLERAPLVATVAADSRVRVWNAQRLARHVQLAEPGHVAVAYTCMALGSLAPAGVRGGGGGGARKKAAAAEPEPERTVLALGSQRGVIVVFDVARGAVMARLGGGEGAGGEAAAQGHTQAVTSVAFSADGATIFSAGSDRRLLVWDLREARLRAELRGGRNAHSCVAAAGDGRVLAAATGIVLWDVAAGAPAAHYAGHGAPVSALSVAPEARLFLSAAAGDRFVALWRLPGDGDAAVGSAASPATPLHSFALDAPARSVSLSPHADADGAHRVVCVSAAQQVTTWRWRERPAADAAAGDAAAVSQLSQAELVVRVAGARAARSTAASGASASLPEAAPTLAAAQLSPAELLIVRGSPLRLALQRLTFVTRDGRARREVQLAAQPAEAALVDAGDEAMAVAAAAAGAQASRKRRAEPAETVLAAAGADTGFSARPAKIARTAGDEGVGAVHSTREQASALIAAARSGPAASGSLQTVLSQALRTGDETLLEFCLGTRDMRELQRTVDRLPIEDVMPLLAALVARFQARPHRGAQLLEWLRALLTRHASLLVAQPALPDSLMLLNQAVSARLSSFKKLLRVAGRLTLLLGALRGRSSAAASEAGATAPLMALVEEGGKLLVADAASANQVAKSAGRSGKEEEEEKQEQEQEQEDGEDDDDEDDDATRGSKKVGDEEEEEDEEDEMEAPEEAAEARRTRAIAKAKDKNALIPSGADMEDDEEEEEEEDAESGKDDDDDGSEQGKEKESGSDSDSDSSESSQSSSAASGGGAPNGVVKADVVRSPAGKPAATPAKAQSPALKPAKPQSPALKSVKPQSPVVKLVTPKAPPPKTPEGATPSAASKSAVSSARRGVRAAHGSSE
jgi:U3 small nucleolar RNA-associated protein 5